MDQERREDDGRSVVDELPLSISAFFDMRLHITFNGVARIFGESSRQGEETPSLR